MIQYRVLWTERLACHTDPSGYLTVPWSGRVHTSFEDAEIEANARRIHPHGWLPGPMYSNVMIEARRKSDQPWPRASDEEAQP